MGAWRRKTAAMTSTLDLTIAWRLLHRAKNARFAMTDVVAVSFTAGKAWRARYGELATTVTGPAPRNKHSRDTTIALDHLWLSAETLDLDRDQSIEVSVDITNTGSRPGKEVIQLYVADLESTAQKPPKELKGFAKVEVMPGETKTATFTIDRRALQHYDPQQERWCVEPGAFEVLVGNSSADIRLRGRFRASGFNPYGYGPDTPVARVMNDEPKGLSFKL